MSRSNTPELDNEVLTVLHTLAAEAAEDLAPDAWESERGLRREAQWHAHVRHLIDRDGRFVASSEQGADGPLVRNLEAEKTLSPERSALLIKELRHFHNVDERTDSARVRKLQSGFETLATDGTDEAILPILKVLHLVRDRSTFFEALRRRQTVPAPLLTALKEKSDQIRINALDTIARMSPRADNALPDLICALSDRNETVHLLATWALGRMGEKAQPAVEVLLRSRKRNPEAVDAALVAIGSTAVPAIARGLEVPASAYSSAVILMKIGVQDPELKNRVAAQFLESMKSENREARIGAALFLGGINLDDPSVSEALTAAAGIIRQELRSGADSGDEEGCVSFETAARALWKITGDSNEVLPLLIAELEPQEGENGDDYREFERFAGSCDVEALAILSDMGADAVGATRRLVRYLRRAESAGDAVSAVWRRTGPGVVPDLLERLEKIKAAPYVMQTILETVGGFGAGAAEAIPVLQRLSVGDKSEKVRGWARDALMKIEQDISRHEKRGGHE